MQFKLSESFILITSNGENHFGAMADYHYHEQTELYFLLSGECRYFIGNKIYQVSSGQIVIIPGGMIHKTIYRTQKRNRMLISFKNNFIDFDIFLPSVDLSKPAIFEFNSESLAKVKNVFLKIEKEVKNIDKFSKDMCRCLCFELFSLITREGKDITESKGQKNEPGSESAVIEKITKYITEQYYKHITLKDAAKSVNFSVGYLSKMFKKVTGMGFKEYLITVRILNAKELLKNTNMPVSRIAFDCGFNDSNYFSKMFSVYSDCSPLKYRKKTKKILANEKKLV